MRSGRKFEIKKYLFNYKWMYIKININYIMKLLTICLIIFLIGA